MAMLLTTIPAFAADIYNNQDSDFTGQPLPYNVTDSANLVKLYTTVNENNIHTSEGAYVTVQQDIYAVHVGTYFYFISQENIASGSVVVWRYEGFNGGKTPITTSSTTVNLDGQSYYYVTRAQASTTSGSTTTIYVPHYGSLTDAVNAVDDYINSTVNPPVPPPTGNSVTYDVPYGNAIIFEISGLQGQGTIIQQSNNPSFNFYSSVSGGMFTTLPSTIEYPMSGLIQYSWSGSGRTDTSGRYNYFATSFSYDARDISDNSYYVVVNPPFTAGVAVDYVLNQSITVSVSNVSSFQVVPLNTQVSYGGNQTSVQDGEGGTGVYDPDTGNWNVTDSEGNPYAPVDGGTDLPSQPTMTIHDYLQNIANTIKGFFSGAIGAISTLVSSGSAFMRQLVSLYAWLPSPVYSVLSAALILVITIGVVKAFL